MSSEVSSEPGRESDVGDLESMRQSESRREICAWSNKDLGPKQGLRGRIPVPRKGAS